ncbi:hypothetical protein ABZ281_02610 [Streptomyces sp. NPDC006265]|uniref:hypothetical protein n=1 Tax=Streptomyces sp. NPDC006265 TaxID=3156740 RepID=UPI0033ACFFE8
MLFQDRDWYRPRPRYEVRTRKDRDDKPVDLAIWDESRSAYIHHPDHEIFTLPLDTPEEKVRQVVADFERTRRRADVVFIARRRTKKGRVVREMSSVCGDVIEQGYGYRVVLDLGNNRRVIPAERHVRTIWGTAVKHFYTGSHRAEDDAITEDKVEVEGWTEPRHEELFRMACGISVEPWFARFARHFNLGGKHFQWQQVAALGHKEVPMIANPNAHWLLRAWNQEHPDVARRLFHFDDPDQTENEKEQH